MASKRNEITEETALELASAAFALAAKPDWRLSRARLETIGTGNRSRRVWIVSFRNLKAEETGFEPSIATVEVHARTGKAAVRRLL